MLLLASCIGTAFADLVKLKDGTTLEGSITQRSTTSIKVMTSSGISVIQRDAIDEECAKDLKLPALGSTEDLVAQIATLQAKVQELTAENKLLKGVAATSHLAVRQEATPAAYQQPGVQSRSSQQEADEPVIAYTAELMREAYTLATAEYKAVFSQELPPMDRTRPSANPRSRTITFCGPKAKVVINVDADSKLSFAQLRN